MREPKTFPAVISGSLMWRALPIPLMAGDVLHGYGPGWDLERIHIVEAVGPSGEPRLGRDLLTRGTP